MLDQDALHSGFPDCFDIRESVYLRMVPKGAARDHARSASNYGELESVAFRRFFSSIREAAVFCFQAGVGRGVVLWTKNSMQYVPERQIPQTLCSARPETRAAAARAATDYNPECQAVLAMLVDDFETITPIGPEDTTPISIGKLIGYDAA